MALRNLADVEVLVEGLDHPEGVTWGPDGHAYAGGEAGQIYRVDLQARAFEQAARIEGFILGLACDAAANVYACNVQERLVQRVAPNGSVAVVSSGTSQRPMQNPNYPVFHPSGDLYVSDSGVWDDNDGRIYRIRANGACELFSEAARHFTNGMCLSRDAAWLYVVESTLPGVTRIGLNADGSAGEREIVATLPDHVPDGVQFDEAGHLYISCYTPSRILRMEPSGRIDVLVEDPRHTLLASPTNISFGGGDRRDLLIASLGRWHLGRLRMDTPGLALHYPAPIAVTP